MGWNDALQYATSPLGVGVISGVLLSWLADYFPAFTVLDPKVKRLVFLGVSLLVPIVASLLMAATGVVVLSWDPLIWDAIVAGITAFGAGTMLNARSLPTKAERDAFEVFRARYGAHDV